MISSGIRFCPLKTAKLFYVPKRDGNCGFKTINEVFELAEKTREGAKQQAQQSLRYFHPLLVVNRDSARGRVNKLKLRKMVAKYLGIDIPELGNIPEDGKIDDALKAYLPVCELYPTSPAALARTAIAEKLGKVIALFSPKAKEN